MDHTVVETLALTLGAGWASGINLYATILTLGLMNAMGYTSLPPGLEILSDPLVLAAAGFMYFVEFFADKTPVVDTGWDGLHTFIRIPAGALLAAGAASGLDVSQAAQLAAALVGGSLAASSHFTKAGSRVLINASPEPVTNWTASFAEDIAVIAGLWTALSHPWVFLVLLAVLVLIAIWVLPKLWYAISQLFHKLSRFFGTRQSKPEEAPADGRKDVLGKLYKDERDKPD